MAAPEDVVPDDDQASDAAQGSASRTQSEPGRQHESEPLVSAPIIHHCHIGVVVIKGQQCPLLHNQLFHPPNEDPLLHGKRLRGPSDANVESAARRQRGGIGGALDAVIAASGALDDALTDAGSARTG